MEAEAVPVPTGTRLGLRHWWESLRATERWGEGQCGRWASRRPWASSFSRTRLIGGLA